mgnify:CR=1 FL=1
MSKDINIKDCRKAVNRAKYNPTAERKAQALKLLTELMDAVSNLEEVAPKATKPKSSKSNPLARKAAAGKTRNRNEKLERQQAKANVSTTYLKPEVEQSYQAPRKEVYTLSEGETVETAMAKLRTKRLAEAEALAIAEFEATLEVAPF